MWITSPSLKETYMHQWLPFVCTGLPCLRSILPIVENLVGSSTFRFPALHRLRNLPEPRPQHGGCALTETCRQNFRHLGGRSYYNNLLLTHIWEGGLVQLEYVSSVEVPALLD